jgi:N-acetyl-anhydromuramyl-L-alanine amidase AmpD
LKAGKQVKKAHRKVVVFTSLIGVLVFTSALLMALAPAPLTPDATNSLFAVDAPASMDAVFQTQVDASNTGWKYVYIHHSRSTASNTTNITQPNGELSDHFIIGNGDGLADGEVQMGQRWEQQQSAHAPVRGTQIDPACISICVVGDFDQSRPTPTQIRRLAQLVNAIQARYRIPLSNVALADQPKSVAGVGRFFPVTAFREQLIP